MNARAGVFMIIAAALAAAAGLAAAPAAAQTNPCLALPTDQQRLYCLREARAGMEAAAAAEAAAQAAPQTFSPTPSPATPGGQSAAVRCMALPTDDERLTCMQDALVAAESALASADSDEGGGGLFGLGILGDGGGGKPNALYASESEFAQGFGAGQVAMRTNTSDEFRAPRVRAAIVSYRERVPGLLQFELDNGQIWNQTNADTQRVRLTSRDPVAVDMYESWAGGYRMHLLEMDRVLKVERIE